MFNKITAAIVFSAGALLASQAANAIAITLDNSSPTIVRPATGSLVYNFTGHITIADGFEPGSIQGSTLFTATGDQINSQFPIPNFNSKTGKFNLDGTLFSLTISALDGLGLYQFGNSALTELTFIRYFECVIGTTNCRGATVNYSVNLVARAVPEPATIALFGLALLCLPFAHQKWRRDWKLDSSVLM